LPVPEQSFVLRAGLGADHRVVHAVRRREQRRRPFRQRRSDQRRLARPGAGTNVMIFEKFSPQKIGEKVGDFYSKTACYLNLKNVHNICFQEKRGFFSRNLVKIAENGEIITLAPVLRPPAGLRPRPPDLLRRKLFRRRILRIRVGS
jgi:hypothetical protein